MMGCHANRDSTHGSVPVDQVPLFLATWLLYEVLFCSSVERRPQAALISSPRLARMVAVMPLAFRLSRKASISLVPGLLYSDPGMAWKRIRFIRQRIPLRIFASSLTWAGVVIQPPEDYIFK